MYRTRRGLSCAVQKARQASVRIQRSRGGRGPVVRADVEEPLRGRAEELELVDGLAGADLAQLRRPVGGEDEHRDPRLPRLDHGGHPRWAAAVPEVTVTAAGNPVALAKPSAKNPAQRSSSCDHAVRRSSRARASRIGELREPGDVDGVPHPAAGELVHERTEIRMCRLSFFFFHARTSFSFTASPRPERAGSRSASGSGGTLTVPLRPTSAATATTHPTHRPVAFPAVLRRLRRASAAERFTLAGYSMGGRIALAFDARRLRRARSSDSS